MRSIPAVALLLFTALACGAASEPPPSDAWQGKSNNGLYRVIVQPESGSVAVGELQSWVLNLTDASGEPVYPAQITIGGGMRGHGHGLPTQPQVTAYGGNGDYRVEGMRISMFGDWTLSVVIDAAAGSDRVDIEMNVAPTAAQLRGAWTAAEFALLETLALPENLAPPPSPSNRWADSDAAAELGEALFFDDRLASGDGRSCAGCHQPGRYFTDGLARSRGAGETLRNAPTVVGAAFNRWFYWDGRRDSLWAQALIPFEAADEMGRSRVGVLRTVAGDANYRAAYEALFGAFPDDVLDRVATAEAGPFGEKAMRDAWRDIPLADQRALNAAYANLGKAIAAYERTLLPEPTRFDRYVRALAEDRRPAKGDRLSRDEIAGAKLFIDAARTQCLQCHNGMLQTNGEFHNIGTGNFSGNRMDFGRVFGLRAVLMDEFNCVGPYSDAAPEQCGEIRFLNRDSHIPLQGAFKTPSLRGLAETGPYFHDGRFDSLADVIDHYVNPPAPETAGPHELRTLDLDENERRQLERFLLTLSP